MARQILTGVDCGDYAIKVVVIEYDKKNTLPKILSVIKTESNGFHRGVVVDVHEAQASIQEAIRSAEKTTNQKIKRVFLGVSNSTLSSQTIDSSVIVTHGESQITDYDTKRLFESAEAKLSDHHNLFIHDVIPLAYTLDGRKLLKDPLGMKGSKLELRAVYITSLKRNFTELIDVFEESGLHVEDVIPAPLSSSIVTLTKPQKLVGCVLVDIGSEVTTAIVYDDGLPHSVTSFEYGSQNITSDIALGFKISLEEAEDIKTGQDPRMFPQKKLDEIISARASDIFELIDTHLKKIGRNALLPAGIIISGGGALIPKIDSIAEECLDLPARIGSPIFPQHIKGLATAEPQGSRIHLKDPSLSVAYGTAIFGASPEAKGREFGVQERAGRDFLSGAFRWMRNFLP